MAALTKSATSAPSELNAMDAFARQFKQRNTQVDTHQAHDKYRMPMIAHVNHITRLPHSQPSVRSLNMNSLFPSVENLHKVKSVVLRATDEMV